MTDGNFAFHNEMVSVRYSPIAQQQTHLDAAMKKFARRDKVYR